MITITFEDTVIRIAVNQGRAIKNAFSVPVPENMIIDGIVMDTGAMGLLIKDILKANGISENEVTTSVSGNHAIYRVVRLPQLPANMIPDAAGHELAKAIPVPLAEMYTSWQSLSITHDEIILALLAIPRDNIDSVLNTIKAAGLSCRQMDLKPLALSRVTDQLNAVVINIQPRGFDIVIMVEGIPEIVRSLLFTRNTMTPHEILNEVKEELDRTVTFYNSGKPAITIGNDTPIFISGDFQAIGTEIKAFFSGGPGYQKRDLPHLIEYPQGCSFEEFAVNTGLIFKQLKAEPSLMRVNINVLPVVYQPRKVPVTKILLWVFIVIAVLILAIVGMNTQQSFVKTGSLKNQLETSQKQISTMQVTKTDYDKYQAELAKAKADVASISKLLEVIKNQRKDVISDMGVITGSLSGYIKPTSIVCSSGWTVKGIARNPDAIFEYVHLLQGSGAFNNVVITTMQEISIAEWNFTITIE
jgi:type IV pilus assembly protein PilM